MNGSSNPKRDHRQEVTNNIIKMLEEGTSPWQKPWSSGALQMPFNPVTGKTYRGGNAINLLATALSTGSDDPRWLTYKQAEQNGWHVRKGEKGTHIEFWEFPSSPGAEETSERSTEEDKGGRARPIHRVYTVFNARQIDGIPEQVRKERQEFEVVQAAEAILLNSGALIQHDQLDRAFYDRRTDGIHLPPRAAFDSSAAYYGTALHELGHWSGHESRLNRSTLSESKTFGDESYAREELRAELASVFLAAERGIPHDPANHAAYVGSWIKALQNDKNEIFKAARDAHRAADFILALEREQSVDRALRSVQDGLGLREAADHTTEFGPDRLDGKPSAQTKLARPAADDLKKSFAEAQQVVRLNLGDKARTFAAQTDSGVYCGEVLGETDLHLVQRLSDRSAVAHMKHLLKTRPDDGAAVLITYSHNNARVQSVPERSREKEMAR